MSDLGRARSMNEPDWLDAYIAASLLEGRDLLDLERERVTLILRIRWLLERVADE